MKPSAILSLLLSAEAARACLTAEERGEAPGLQVRQSGTGTPIGTGDRFSGGTVAPQGLGTRPASSSFATILSAAEVTSGLQALSRTYGFSTFTTPYTTFEGRSILGGKIGGTGGTCNDAYHVYLNGNIHARERASADGLLYFISDLLYADRAGTGLTYGSKTYTNAQVKTALSAGIVFIPLSNPDGVVYDQATNSCWRKNRNTASGTSGSSVGVDLNRNFDFVWDFQDKFSASAVSGGSLASTSPSSEIYHGTAPFSEPETKSVKWVLDTYKSVRWFVDLHSVVGDILYSWGSDTNQGDFPAQNFLNTAYDSVRGTLTDTPGVGNGYGEYIPNDVFDVNVETARRMATAMTSAGGRTYTIMPAADLYPTSGASDDYSFSRHMADPSLNLVHAYTVEFGFQSSFSCPFYPTVAQYNLNLKEIAAGFMEMVLAAVELDLGPGSC